MRDHADSVALLISLKDTAYDLGLALVDRQLLLAGIRPHLDNDRVISKGRA
ncbi:MAG: hypothetical protein AB7Q23_16485 [Hyphomonadaceae bacterium]